MDLLLILVVDSLPPFHMNDEFLEIKKQFFVFLVACYKMVIRVEEECHWPS